MTALWRLLVLCGLLLAAGPSLAQSSPMVTAGIQWTGGKAQFFLSDGTYVRYDIAADRVDPGYPQAIDNKSWPGLGPFARDIVATCNGPQGKAYIFLRDGTYLRYDIAQDRVDAGYPKPVDDRNWPGLGPYGRMIRGALNWSGGKIQFFLNDGRFIRYDVRGDHVDAGYPMIIDRNNLPTLAPYAQKLAGMVNWDNGKAYMFLDNGQYLRFDIPEARVDDGYPKPANDQNWPGLGRLLGRR